MKDVQEIMLEIDSITKKQIAIDLSEEEKKELASLIGAESNVVLQGAVADPCCSTISPTATCPPCILGTFCTLITVPHDFTPIPGQVHAGVSPLGSFTINPAAGTCTATLTNGCTIILNRATVNGTAKVLASAGFTDANGNCAFVCGSDLVCFVNADIVCCTVIDPTAPLRFTVGQLASELVTSIPAASGCAAVDIYRVTGTVTPTC